jgi:hypothetical protein
MQNRERKVLRDREWIIENVMIGILVFEAAPIKFRFVGSFVYRELERPSELKETITENQIDFERKRT